MNVTALSETQQLVKDAIKDFLEREVPFNRIREVEASGDYDRDLWKDLVDNGWLGLPFAEEIGGQGGELSDFGILLEELQRRAVLIPILETIVCGVTIARYGDTATALDIVGKILSGKVTLSPAILEESDGFDDISLEVSGGKVSGEKCFVDYGQHVTHHLVVAKEGGEIGLYLVDARSSAAQARPLANIGKVPQANVIFSSAIANRVAGADGFQFLLRLGRVFSAIQCLACSQQALDMTVDYVGIRVQFDQPIGAFQAVQQHCADMATHTLATRFLAYEALWMLDRGTATDTQINIAKTEAARTASYVPMQAHHLHGGIGMVREYDLHFFSLRGKQASLSWGSTEECLAKVADTVEEPEQWL